MTQISVNKLKEIANTNQTAHVIFERWASRQRKRDSIDVIRFRSELMREGIRVIPEEYHRTFKELENEGIGTLRKNRFILNYNLKQIGKAAIENGQETIFMTNGDNNNNQKQQSQQEQQPRRRRGRPKRGQQQQQSQQQESSKTNIVMILLRPDFEIQFKIPADISQDEANKLADFIRNFPNKSRAA